MVCFFFFFNINFSAFFLLISRCISFSLSLHSSHLIPPFR